MSLTRDVRILVLGGLAVLAVVFALTRMVSCASGPARPFRERQVPAETVRAIDEILREMVALGPQTRETRLQGLLGPDAPPQAAAGLLAQFEALRAASAWRLVEAVGYGPTVIKAILDVTDAAGDTRPVAILFESAEGGLRLVGVLP